jgi:tRNA 2-thiouridine synthesizing protein A
MPETDTTIDARGHRCPVPTLKLRRALETFEHVTLIADDPMAQIDVPHFCMQNGLVLEGQESHDSHWVFRVSRADARRN